MLGDDGRIFTSRNTGCTGANCWLTQFSEPLYGVMRFLIGDPDAKVIHGYVLNEFIYTPGQVQTATINVGGAYKKEFDITPYNLGPNLVAGHFQVDLPLYDANNSDDVISGGFDDDFLHGASGDDAIGGGEALPDSYVQHFSGAGTENGLVRTDWTRPYNPGDLLLFGADTDPWNAPKPFASRLGEFYLYDEYDARRAILFNANGTVWKTGAAPTNRPFLLNLLATEGRSVTGCGAFTTNGTCTLPGVTVLSDGDDIVFGDLGNDWSVGGTGRDQLYAGWGNDLTNADDVQTTNGSLNDTTDPHEFYFDRAYGGAGADVLYGNSFGDRLIDWVGEWNSYIVPFSPFGIGAVSRQVEPQLPEFLYARSASDGADPTRDTDTGRPAIRNGEYEGEIGLVIQQDHGVWQQQTGGPTDPQPGGSNGPGGTGTKKDTLQAADFNNGTQNAFAVDSGVWEVNQGTLGVGAASLGQDASAVFYLDQYKPIYFEITAQIKVQKPLAGWKANAYLIFDYFSPTDFKFAGIDIAINKLVMGHRDASGWHVDVQSPAQLKPDVFFNVLVAINGTTVTVQVDGGVAMTHTFAPRIIEGEPVGLNKGFVGAGSDNSRGVWDNFTVQVLPPQLTLDAAANFSAGPAPFTGDSSGAWTATGGRYGSTAAGDTTAMSAADFGADTLNTLSWVELSATLRSSGIGGIAFDVYAPDRFKFAAIDVASQRILIGHVDRGRWVVDTVAARALAAGTDYTLVVTLKGSTASVQVNGTFAVSHAFNAGVVDGAAGVLSRSGTTSVDVFRFRTNDRAYAGTPWVSAGDAGVGEGAATATVTLTLSEAAANPVTVGWSTVDGTGRAGLDYVAGSGSVTFAPGATTAQVTVALIGDTLSEPSEAFDVVLTGATGANVGDDAGQVTIADDDPALPQISIDDVTLIEGNRNTTTINVTLRRIGPTSGASTVVATTVAGTALAGSDFVSRSATVTFAAGAATATFQVGIVNDTVGEPSETFTVVLSSPVGASIADGTGVVTINDNDGGSGAKLATSSTVAPTASAAPLRRRSAVTAAAAGATEVRAVAAELPASAARSWIASRSCPTRAAAKPVRFPKRWTPLGSPARLRLLLPAAPRSSRC